MACLYIRVTNVFWQNPRRMAKILGHPGIYLNIVLYYHA